MPRLEQCNARVEDLEAVDAKGRQQGLVWQDMARYGKAHRRPLQLLRPTRPMLTTYAANRKIFQQLESCSGEQSTIQRSLKRTAASTSSQILQLQLRSLIPPITAAISCYQRLLSASPHGSIGGAGGELRRVLERKLAPVGHLRVSRSSFDRVPGGFQVVQMVPCGFFYAVPMVGFTTVYWFTAMLVDSTRSFLGAGFCRS